MVEFPERDYSGPVKLRTDVSNILPTYQGISRGEIRTEEDKFADFLS